MSADKSKNLDYQPLGLPAKNGGAKSGDQPTLQSPRKSVSSAKDQSLKNPHKTVAESEKLAIARDTNLETETIKILPAQNPVFEQINLNDANESTFAAAGRQKRKDKKAEKDRLLLSRDHWLVKNGHTFSYVGLYLFSVLVLFRPYELFSPLSFLSSTAFYFAAATLAVFIPTQFSAEGSLSVLSTEIKCILALTFLALATIPIAKDPGTAWTVFNDVFIKAVLMFIVMVNVVRTRERLMGLVWLSLTIGIYLSYTALNLYMKGEFKVEGYRVGVEVGGLFGNPNDMALHLVTIMPLALTLGIASRHKIWRFVYFAMAGLFVAANMITFSRGGFIGLLASSVVLTWKLGRRNRLNVSIASIVGGGLFILLAPGNYGLRLLSIFIPALDPVGSSDQRKELLIRSIVVTLRNPWGIGIGNFPIVSIHNLVTHNSFTQISSELGILGLAAYLIFLISPFKKLAAIERTLFARDESNWFYYVSIGFQASIIGYMFSSFFVAVAYNWFVYYLIAYAVAFRRIYNAAEGIKETEKGVFGLPTI